MKSDNGAMRDPAIYRCNLTPHAQTKDTYKAYPTYDLACPIVDSLEGVTHTLRDSQYADRDPQYRWFLDNLGLRQMHFQPFSRINFVKTLLSKRKLQWLIDQKQAEGWDDPRFPTVAGVLRRGMTVKGLKDFILSMGASKNTNLMEWDKIWAMNREVVDPVATRYTALLANGLVRLTLSGAPAEPYAETIFRHPKDQSLGKKVRCLASPERRRAHYTTPTTQPTPSPPSPSPTPTPHGHPTQVRYFSGSVLLQADDAAAIAEGEEVTLMSWGNAIVQTIEKDSSGKVVGMRGALNLAGSVKSTKKKLTWLADTSDNLVDVELIDLDYMLTKVARRARPGQASPRLASPPLPQPLPPLTLASGHPCPRSRRDLAGAPHGACLGASLPQDKIEEDDDLGAIFNPNTVLPYAAKGEAAMRSIKRGETIQVERLGFYVCDVPYVRPADPIKLFFVPDGKKFMGFKKQ